MNSIFNLKGCYTRVQWWQINLLIGYIFCYWYIYAQEIFYATISFNEIKHSSGLSEFIPTAFYDSPLDLLDIFSTSNGSAIFITVLYIAILLGLLWINITSSIKRLHDINRKGSVWLLSFIPVLGPIVIFILNAFYPSTQNPYCEKHTKNNYPVFLLFALLLQIPLVVDYIYHNNIIIPTYFLSGFSLLSSSLYVFQRVVLVVLLLSFGLYLDRFSKAKFIGLIGLSSYFIYEILFQIYHYFIIEDFSTSDMTYLYITLSSSFLIHVLIVFFSLKYYKKTNL